MRRAAAARRRRPARPDAARTRTASRSTRLGEAFELLRDAAGRLREGAGDGRERRRDRTAARLPRRRLDRPQPAGGDRARAASPRSRPSPIRRRVPRARCASTLAATSCSSCELDGDRDRDAERAARRAGARGARARARGVLPEAARARRRRDAARSSTRRARADRLLGVDLSYRHTAAAQRDPRRRCAGQLGEVYAVDLVFHNAYGPDKPWFYDPALVGRRLRDRPRHPPRRPRALAARLPAVEVERRLRAALPRRDASVEDYAAAQLELAGGAVVRLACSWHLHAGRDCVIEAAFYGTRRRRRAAQRRRLVLRLRAERYTGTRREPLVAPPDDWGGRAAVDVGARARGAASASIPRPSELVARRRGARPDLRTAPREGPDDGRHGRRRLDLRARARARARAARRRGRARDDGRAARAPAQRARAARVARSSQLPERDFALEWMDDPWDDVDARRRLAARARRATSSPTSST